MSGKHEGAERIAAAYDAARARFDELTARARRRFENREWHGAQRDAADRLSLYKAHVDEAVEALRTHRAPAAGDDAAWAVEKDAYARAMQGREDAEIAVTFFNSVTRRLFGTVGVNPRSEFVAEEAAAPPAAAGEAPVHAVEGPIGAALVAALLERYRWRMPYARLERDAAQAAAAIARACGVPDDGPVRLELLAPVFFRNKGAYLVGRARRPDAPAAPAVPLVFALLHDVRGLVVDAVLATSDEASVVFGFSWSYFRVAAPRPRALVDYLAQLMPLKRIDELYTAIGFNKHGKTELYRGLRAHLEGGGVEFVRAAGDEGLVMAVIALPSFNLVVKLIKDTFGQPKTTTRRAVMGKYQLVFVRDRAGRLADAQEFERLALPRRCVPEPLLASLMASAGGSIQAGDETVVLGHCYTERYVTPLNLFLRSATPDAAAEAIVDYGAAIRDLAGANIFTGDMLQKNFGVSRHGRVIFYDYDELTLLTDCQFRRIPPPRDYEDEMRAEPWYGVGEQDVFPEEFASFLVPPGALREVFLDAHADLLDPDWWIAMQVRVRRGALPDVFPYRAERRLVP